MQSRSYDNWVCAYNIKALNLFDPELQLINTKPVIKNILKGLLGELKKFKVHTNLLFKNKKINDHKPMHKIFHPTAKLLLNDSDINKAFRSLNQSAMTKIKNLSQQRFSCETSQSMVLRFLSVSIGRNNSIEKYLFSKEYRQ